MHAGIRLAVCCCLILLAARESSAQFPPATDCNGNFRGDLSELELALEEDCNRDGAPDICSLQPRGYRFAGEATNTETISSGPSDSARIADLNGDGRHDLLIRFPGDSDHLKVFLADASGGFNESADFELGANGAPLTVLQGLLGVDAIAGDAYFKNDGNAAFTKIALSGISGVVAAKGELSGDLAEDILLRTQLGMGEDARYSLQLFVNQGNGSFAGPQLLLENAPLFGIELADVNEDGRTDIVVARPGSNQTEIRIFLVGPQAAITETLDATVPGISTLSLQLADIDQSGGVDLLLGFEGAAYRALDIDIRSGMLDVAIAGRNICGLGDLIDIDGDGDLDFTCDRATRPTSCCFVFYRYYNLNDGQGYFFFAGYEEQYSSASVMPQSRLHEVLVDVTNDGRPDSVAVFSAGLVGLQDQFVRVVTQGASMVLPPAEQDANRDFVPDSCNQEGLLFTRYSLWNSFASLVNILELVNTHDAPVQLRVRLRDLLGQIVNSVDLQLAAGQQFDLILNEFSALSAPSYGLVEVLSSEKISGAVTYYRQTPLQSRLAAGFDTGDYDFAFQIPLAVPSYLPKTFLFNSYQPSAFGADFAAAVHNWLTIVNLSPQTTGFAVQSRLDGNPAPITRGTQLTEFNRIDLDGGHGLAPGFNRGFHVVNPDTEGRPYLALLTRYGSTFDPDRFAFAFPSFDAKLSTIVSTGGGAATWLEIANALDSELVVLAQIADAQGNQIVEQELRINPSANAHFLINNWLGTNATGTLRLVQLSGVGSFHAQVVSYFYSGRNGSIETAYLLSAHTAAAARRTASYNLYLGTFNWLRAANAGAGPLAPTATVLAPGASGSPLSLTPLTLPPAAVAELDLHNGARFGTTPDSYGTVQLDVNADEPLAGDLLRVRPTLSGGFDFIMHTGLQ